MSFIEILLALLLFSAIATTLASKIKMPAEIFLLLASLLVSFIPGLPDVNFKPNLLLVLFIPPIIFSAAFFTSWRDFVANKRPITMLAIGLVLFTMCVVAVVMKLLIPAMSWAVCFIFGAIVSPTDASSAISIVKKLNIPRRLITIIEGESLINDATALVAYRYAIAALMTGTFSLWGAGVDFFIAALGGVILGYLIGWLSTRMYIWLTVAKAQNIFSLLVPYFAYIIADRLRISPIICLVTAGIYFSRKFPIITGPLSRHKAHTVWEQFIFVINGLIFILIGLQLRFVIQDLGQFSWSQIISYVVIINVVILFIRFAWVYPSAYIPRYFSAKLRENDPVPHWSALATLSWIGMRGLLSLILVMSLPNFLPSGEPFPYRSLLILLTYSIILITLLLPTLTLSLVSKWFHFEKDSQFNHEEALARIVTMKAVLEELDRNSQASTDIKGYIEKLRVRYIRRLAALESNLKDAPYSTLNKIDQKIRKLTRNLINTERKALIDLRKNGVIHDDVFHRLERELDLEDMRLKSPRI
ncbi:MAG: Na+/H+ antiporter [Gammaproteobacteria bacterium]|nr:Na+/H+ antiporter [Gammaproteobacteria bacterium]